MLGLPTRVCKVRSWGKFEVPRHIVRIEIEKGHNTSGWQVRYRRPFRFFNDGPQSKLNPRQSLAEACRYLASIYRGPKNKLKTIESSRKLICLGMPGINLVWRQRRHRHVLEWYLIATPPHQNTLPKSFYLGTDNTVSDARFDDAILNAMQWRTKQIGRGKRANAAGVTEKR